MFGWATENDADEKGAPCLEKVGKIDVMRKEMRLTKYAEDPPMV